jgi:hypothetical protein
MLGTRDGTIPIGYLFGTGESLIPFCPKTQEKGAHICALLPPSGTPATRKMPKHCRIYDTLQKQRRRPHP